MVTMSLLTSGPHRVAVTPARRTQDRTGRYVYEYRDSDAFLREGVAVQPLSMPELVTADQLESPQHYIVIGSGAWPAGPHSRIVWDGREYEQEGEAVVYGMSPRTAHYEVRIVRATAEPR